MGHWWVLHVGRESIQGALGCRVLRESTGDFVKGREPHKWQFYLYSSLGGGSWPGLGCVDSETTWVMSSPASKLIP